MRSTEKAFCGCFDQQYVANDRRYNIIKEQISYSYLRAIVSYMGGQLQKTGHQLDDDGIDVTIRLPQGRLGHTKNPKPEIDVQVKSTTSPIYSSDGKYLNYDLKVSVYNAMREANSSIPTMFMILVLPTDVGEWVDINDNEMILKHIMYWYSTVDSERTPAEDQSTIRLKIPVRNIVNTDSLQMIMRCSANEEIIRNEVM